MYLYLICISYIPIVVGDILNHPLSPWPVGPVLLPFFQAEEAGQSLGVSDRVGAFLRAFADVGCGI
jgi:hypothetical protein